MGKTGFRGHYYLLAGGAGAVVGFSYNAMSRNVLVEYANGILSRFVSDETTLAILKRITPSLYGFGLAVVLLGISRRVRAHLVRALLSYDGWFLRGPKVNRKLVTVSAFSLKASCSLVYLHQFTPSPAVGAFAAGAIRKRVAPYWRVPRFPAEVSPPLFGPNLGQVAKLFGRDFSADCGCV